MGSIMTGIQLTDRMTGPLQNICGALNSTIQGMQEVQSASGRAFDPTLLNSARAQIEIANGQMTQLSASTRSAGTSQLAYNNTVASGVSRTSRLLSNVKGLVAGFAGIAAIAATVKNAVGYASDLNEVQNVVDVSFGESSKAVNDWAKSCLDSYGMNEVSAKRYAGTMGAMLKSSGIAGDAVVGMSENMTGLAGDMASFYDLPVDQAFEKIRSGISGETEPLKQLGINMSVANLNAYAMSTGLGKTYDAMSQQEQTILRYNYLLNATSGAQGDFSRTSGSYANQIRLLKENWTEFTGSLASNVLPALTGVITTLNNGISFLQSNWGIIQPILATGLTFLGTFATELLVYNGIKAASAVAEAIHTLALAAHTKATFAAKVEQFGLNAALLACPLTWVVMGLVAVVGGVYIVCTAVNKWKGTHYSATGVIVGAVYTVVSAYFNLKMVIANVAIGIWNVMKACASNIGTAFHNGIANAQNAFYSLQSTAYTCISNIASGLNKLPFVNFDTSGLKASADYYASKAADARGSKNEYKDLGSAFKSGYSTYDAFSSGWAKKSYTKGYDVGANFAKGIKEKFSKKKDDSEEKAKTLANSLANTAANTGKTAGNTSKIANSLDVSNENLKYLRDVAERDIINRFTTASIKVEMTNHNSLSSGADVDGMMGQLSAKLRVALEEVREGVPA